MSDTAQPPNSGLDETLAALWSPVLALATVHQGRTNGMIAATGAAASLVSEGPRVSVNWWKSTFTHATRELLPACSAPHLLAGNPSDALERTLASCANLACAVAATRTPGIEWKPVHLHDDPAGRAHLS